MEYYAAIKRNEILPFTMTWMELEGTMLSEISQAEKDNYYMISLICGSGDATWGLKWVGERWDWEGEKPKETLNLTKQTEGC